MTMSRKGKWIWVIFLAPPVIALFIAIGTEIVMHLWNWLGPAIFGWRLITFWQALGVLILCRILFGGWSGRGGHHSNIRGRMRERMVERMAERWKQMTPEEREKFRSRCSGFASPTGGANEPA